MPRILLFTGKGGVGKTSVAAATALRAAERGMRTLVLSTDAAHSLGDAFAREIGPAPVPLAPHLDGQEIDVYYSVEKHWGKLQEYIQSLFRWRGAETIYAEEMSVLPGMEEVASFLWVHQHFHSGAYDLIVIDSAPTGETLRFLALPEVGRWWMDKLFPLHRKVARVLRPAVERLSDIPLPQETTYDAAQSLFRQLDSIHATFTDPATTSVRVVLNPETMVIKESQRTYTYLHLFGYAVDAVILNRILPADVAGGYFAAMREAQRENRRLIDEIFSPLPVLEAPYFAREVVGPESLRLLAESLYGDRDPAERFSRGRSFDVTPMADGRIVLALALPNVQKDEIHLSQRGDEITITVGRYRRNVLLPRVLQGRAIERARMEEGKLTVSFGPRGPGHGER